MAARQAPAATAHAALQPSRPFSAPSAPGPALAAGHDLGRIGVAAPASGSPAGSVGGTAAPIQRMPPKVKKKTVVKPGSQHHDIAKDKTQPKGLGTKLNQQSANVLALKQNPKFTKLSAKDLKRKVKGMKVT